MVKSLALQKELGEEFGACVFDVTFDLEDGAPVGGERDHAQMVAELARASGSAAGAFRHRVAVRLHPADHPCFAQDAELVLGQVAGSLCHVMLPKVESVGQLDEALAAMDPFLKQGGAADLPIHILVESAHAISQVHNLAAHPRVQSISFGLMDFVSSHGGAIPATAMNCVTDDSSNEPDQFSHPVVVRAKLEISAACHASAKVPAHGVVTEFKHPEVIRLAARRASRTLGFTRMWSIHPDQIRPILVGMSPEREEVQIASDIICAAHEAKWAPIAFQGRLQDRASYRYYWQVLERAQRTGQLPRSTAARSFFQ